jgi:hypothetical protein
MNNFLRQSKHFTATGSPVWNFFRFAVLNVPKIPMFWTDKVARNLTWQ